MQVSTQRGAAEKTEETRSPKHSAQPPRSSSLRVAGSPRRRNESGFALLLVFLMAAILALSLYKEIPRVAFDNERQKEELLVERGEQYKRALEVYVRDLKRYPAKLEDLENTNHRHYLRRRYVDPMTGKDEWRIIHMQNGVLTDSKVQKPGEKQASDTAASAIGQTIGQVAGLGLDATNPNQTNGASLAARRRASDGGATPVDPNNPGTAVPGTPPGYAPGPPGSTQTASGQIPPSTMPPGFPGAPGIPGLPGVAQPGQPQFNNPAVPGQTGAQQLPGSVMPGQTGAPGATGATGGNTGSSYLGGGSGYLGGGGSYLGGSSSPTPTPGRPLGGAASPGGGFQQPGMVPAGTPPNLGQGGANGAGAPGFQQPQMGPGGLANMLGLTGPRPGAMNMTNTNGMPALSNGIAGFASKGAGDSIMIYNDQTDYGLWEFVFDGTKVKPITNPLTGGTTGTPGNQIGTPATQLGTPAGQGNNSGFGNTGGFGSAPGGTGGAPGVPGPFGGGPSIPPPPPPE